MDLRSKLFCHRRYRIFSDLHWPLSWMAQSDATPTKFVVGEYVSGSKNGLRGFPYSADPDVNPLRYSDIKAFKHRIIDPLATVKSA